MSLNTLIFGGLAIASLFIFFNLGKVKASRKQLDRPDRIKRFKRQETKVIRGEVIDENEKGFIKKSNLAKIKTEQNTSRFAEGEKIDAKVLRKNKKEGTYELSIKDLEIEEEKEALKEYGSSSSGASIGDIIGAALEEGKAKSTKDKDEKK